MSYQQPPPDGFDEPGFPDHDPWGYEQPHRGTLILVFGILGLVFCFIFGAVAWSMANRDLYEMDAGRMDPEGRSNTQAGKVLGMISVILALVGIGLMVLMFGFLGVSAVGSM